MAGLRPVTRSPPAVGRDFLAEIDVLALEPIAEALQLFVRLLERLLPAAPIGDVLHRGDQCQPAARRRVVPEPSGRVAQPDPAPVRVGVTVLRGRTIDPPCRQLTGDFREPVAIGVGNTGQPHVVGAQFVLGTDTEQIAHPRIEKHRTVTDGPDREAQFGGVHRGRETRRLLTQVRLARTKSLEGLLSLHGSHHHFAQQTKARHVFGRPLTFLGDRRHHDQMGHGRPGENRDHEARLR